MKKKRRKTRDISWEVVREQVQYLQSKGPALHVIAHHADWAVTKDGTCKASRVFTHKSEAIRYAQDLLTAGAAVSLIVHKTDGSIEQWEDTPSETVATASHCS